jgi:hypothetical protein
MSGKWRGPFHGVPVALKDLCYTGESALRVVRKSWPGLCPILTVRSGRASQRRARCC